MNRLCDYCKKEARYICDFYGNEIVKIAGCEDHKYTALYAQENAIWRIILQQE